MTLALLCQNPTRNTFQIMITFNIEGDEFNRVPLVVLGIHSLFNPWVFNMCQKLFLL